MPAVLVTKPTVTQNLPFLPQLWLEPSTVLIINNNNDRMNRLGWHKPKLRGHLINVTKIHAVASVREASWEELGLESTLESWEKIANTASTHRGTARLSGRECSGMVAPPKVVTNPSTNRARRNLTLLMWPKPLPLHQTSHTLLKYE